MAQQNKTTGKAVLEYHLPCRFLYSEVLLFSLISTLMIFAWIPALISLLSYGRVASSALRAVVFLNVTAVALLLLFFFVKSEMRSLTYKISGGALSRKTSTKELRLPLAAISEVSILKFPFGGGMISVESGGRTIIIPTMVSNAEALLRHLQGVCGYRHGKGDDERFWNDIYTTCRLSHLAITRTDRFFGPLLTLAVLMLPFHIITAVFLWDLPVVPLAVWTVLGPLFPLVVYAASDILIRHKTRKAVFATPDRSGDLPVETIMVRVGCAGFCMYLAAAVLFKLLVR